MDVHDGGQWVVGLAGAVGENTDRLSAKRALDMDLTGDDIRQIWSLNGPNDLKQVGATLRQSVGGQRLQRPQREPSRNSGSTSSMVLMDVSGVHLRLDER